MACKLDGEGPVVHYVNNGKHEFIPEGDISEEKEAEVIRRMKKRLDIQDSEGKGGEF